MNGIIRSGEPGYRQCATTLMDTTDPEITFDDQGVSSWVRYYREVVLPRWSPAGNPAAFAALIRRIKEDGKNKDYDCALGLSGGVDSSYLAHIAKREGLRPLIVHTDAGWNSDIAVRNIEKIVKTCGFDLFTVVIDWDEMADLQRAFLRAGVPDQDIPQDHVIFAAFYGLAAKHRIKWVLSGHNFACESVLPPAWGYDAMDWRHMLAIHRKHGERPLGTFPRMSRARFGLEYTLLRGIRVVKPLNLLPYVKADAMRTLEREFDWQYYGGKHFESRWTRFFQGWWLPTRYGYDKRLAHLSSLILCGQITRAEALQEMRQTPYTEAMMQEDRDLILKKLGMARDEWEKLLAAPLHGHDEYAQALGMAKLMSAGQRMLRRAGFLK
ncbi:MAG: N-acetyl sugar amidotransferase [Opitutae bacterium]|nr:N-acetyl sugar amidotransferase [Opitutae bacterium]